MSYEILYDKQFIKLEQDNEPTQFIPMILCGSNNCTEFYMDSAGRNRERRERNWTVFNLLNGAKYGTEEEMLQKQQEMRDSHAESEGYTDKDFGFFTALAIGGSSRNTTFGKYQGIVKTGCKNALTIEELKENHITLSISNYYYQKDALEAAGIESLYFTPETTEEFFLMLEEFQTKTKGLNINCKVSINATKSDLKWMRKKTNPLKKVRTLVDVEKWWTIQIKDLGTFVRSTARGTKYTAFPSGGKQYMSEAQAKAQLKKIKNRFLASNEVSLVEHNTPTQIWVTSYVPKEQD